MPKIPEAPFIPLHDLILLEFLQKNETKILLPDGASPENIFGAFVIAIGPGRSSEHGVDMQPSDKIKIGDEVLINPNAGTMFTHPATGGRKFVLVRHLDILAVLKPEYARSAEMAQLFGAG